MPTVITRHVVRYVDCSHCEQKIPHLVDTEEEFPDTMYLRLCVLDAHVRRVHAEEHQQMSHPKF